MKFLADENVEKAVVDLLRKRGHDVIYIAEKSPSLSDDEVLKLARREHRILVTNDKDFGELVFLQGKLSDGILLLRLMDESASRKASYIDNLLRQMKKELKGRFVVLTESGVRIRKL